MLGSKPMTSILIRIQKRKHRHTERLCEDGAEKRLETLKVEETRKRNLGGTALPVPGSWTWPPHCEGKQNFCCLSPAPSDFVILCHGSPRKPAQP